MKPVNFISPVFFVNLSVAKWAIDDVFLSLLGSDDSVTGYKQ
jgi:hypothetical protein